MIGVAAETSLHGGSIRPYDDCVAAGQLLFAGLQTGESVQHSDGSTIEYWMSIPDKVSRRRSGLDGSIDYEPLSPEEYAEQLALSAAETRGDTVTETVVVEAQIIGGGIRLAEMKARRDRKKTAMDDAQMRHDTNQRVNTGIILDILTVQHNLAAQKVDELSAELQQRYLTAVNETAFQSPQTEGVL